MCWKSYLVRSTNCNQKKVQKMIRQVWVTFNISMHSSSNLSIACELVRCLTGLPISLAFDGFLNTSNKLRFLFSLALSSLPCRRCASLECWCDWSRIELGPPCKIDLTAWTSRFNGDSLTLFFSEQKIKWREKTKVFLNSLERHHIIQIKITFWLLQISFSIAFWTKHIALSITIKSTTIFTFQITIDS